MVKAFEQGRKRLYLKDLAKAWHCPEFLNAPTIFVVEEDFLVLIIFFISRLEVMCVLVLTIRGHGELVNHRVPR